MKQKPQCYGVNVHRIIFDGKLPARDPAFVPIRVDTSSETRYKLDIGDADGIVQGSRFTVHRKYVASDEPELCTMTVSDIQAFSATLVPDELAATGELPKRIYAKQTGWTEQQELRVHCTSALKKGLDDGILKSHSAEHFDRETGLRFVDTTAVLTIDIEEGKVIFDYQFKSMLHRLPVEADPTHKELLPLLNSAVRWNWDLTRGSPSVTEDVSLEFARLRVIKAGFRTGESEPEENILSENDALLLKKEESYGFALKNHLPTDLHAKIFWFDTVLNIGRCYYTYLTPQPLQTIFPEPIYGGATGRKQEVDPTLRAKGRSFSVGYGVPGVPPLIFTESSVGDTPLGFIRVFIQDRNDKSTKSSTPHPNQSAKPPPTSRRLVRQTPAVVKDKPRWYTITLPIIVK